MLYKMASDKLDSEVVSADDIHHILQGFRNKKSVDFYLKIKKLFLNQKEQIFGAPQEGNEKKWANNLVNVFYSFASNKPKNFGVYQDIAKEEIDELLALYEHDLNEASKYLDGEGITRLAQVMYLLKSKSYENIWWRIENRVHDLAEIEGALDTYNITNILRSFSRS